VCRFFKNSILHASSPCERKKVECCGLYISVCVCVCVCCMELFSISLSLSLSPHTVDSLYPQ